jgi:hypothetical protein
MARYRRFDNARAGTLTMPDAIEGVRLRRAGLRAAMSSLEQALAAPAPRRVDEWRLGVRDTLGALHEVWTRHIVETEAPGAFLDDLVTEAPRLATPVAHLRREHNEVLAIINRAEKTLDQVLLDDDHDRWVEGLRAELTTMLCSLAQHRQRGADLIFAAYDVDIGGG